MTEKKHNGARLKTTRGVVSGKIIDRRWGPSPAPTMERGFSTRSNVFKTWASEPANNFLSDILLPVENPRHIPEGHRQIFAGWCYEIAALSYVFPMLR